MVARSYIKIGSTTTGKVEIELVYQKVTVVDLPTAVTTLSNLSATILGHSVVLDGIKDELILTDDYCATFDL